MVAATSPRLAPAAFLGHGSPMNALETNPFTRAWASFGASAAEPRAILAISAHWYVNYTAVTAMPRPRTIHDFYGFPAALFAVQYPAPGSPELAQEIVEVAKPDHLALDHDGWGLDHGTWSVLVHAFPRANIPVVQLSLNAQRPFEWHVDLGARLSLLRERGVVIVGSGNVVHNLRAIDWQQPQGAFDWARRFDEAARQLLTEQPADAPKLREHPDFRKAVPTDEHFLPLLYLAGAARAAGKPLQAFAEGYAYGSLSMTAYGLDVPPAGGQRERRAAPLPDPVVAPAQDTNT